MNTLSQQMMELLSSRTLQTIASDLGLKKYPTREEATFHAAILVELGRRGLLCAA